ncbi:MAG: patatin-like phospholipase family protein [Candidatus Yanofskybacteria bacterium]|nr:patatin-like phospholipase family protein [Candidatus Yanofskybacteria bacterium]
MAKKRVALILPSEFRRLPAHFGALPAYQEFFPKPDLIVGCSAGAIAGASFLPWTSDNTAKVAELARNLKAKQIYSRRTVEAFAFLTAATSFVPFFNFNRVWSGKKKYLMPAAEVATILALDALFLGQFLKLDSLFSNEPLRKLLTDNLDFERIFSSEIKLEMIAADMETSDEVIFTNYLERDKNPVRFVDGILASSKLAGKFPSIAPDGRPLGDGAILGNAPLHRAIAPHNECDAIILFLYTSVKERRDPPKTFVGDLIKSAQMTEAALTEARIENFYLRKRLGEKLPELLIIEAREPLPDMNMTRFDSENLIRSMNLGYDAVVSNRNRIEKLLS